MKKSYVIAFIILIIFFACNSLFASGGFMSAGGALNGISFSDVTSTRNMVVFFFVIIIALTLIYGFFKLLKKIGCGMTFAEMVIVIAIICILAAMKQPINRGGSRAPARQKACYSNIRVLQGAVEMFNMDCSPMMDDIFYEGFETTEYDYKTKKHKKTTTGLIAGGYLKKKPECPENNKNSVKNEYIAFGKLTEDGEVGCAPDFGKTDDQIGFGYQDNRFDIKYHGTLTGNVPISKLKKE